jgi:hypothetical protein
LAGRSLVQDRREGGVQANDDFFPGIQELLDALDARVGAHGVVLTVLIADAAKNASAPDPLDLSVIDLEGVRRALADAPIASAAFGLGDA